MTRLGFTIALFALLLSPAAADPALPGLVRQDRMMPVTLTDGSQVKLNYGEGAVQSCHRDPHSCPEGDRDTADPTAFVRIFHFIRTTTFPLARPCSR